MILCCGEALIDLIPNDGADPTPLVGGSVLNTAVALGRLGAPVGLLTGLSSDAYGQQIEAHLTESHVHTSFAIRSNRPTTLAIVHFENGQPRYEFRDEGSAMRMITPADMPDIPGTVTAMVFGCISLIGTPVSDALADLCVNRPQGVVALLDTNIRPSFVDDEVAYRARLKRMLATTEIVKASDEDLDWLLPGARDPIAELHAMGPAIVLLTKGADGAEIHTASGAVIRAPAEKVDVVDTVGAGDTFNAGFLKALLDAGLLSPDGLAKADATAIEAALRLGIRAAAVTVSRPGANPPWAKDIA